MKRSRFSDEQIIAIVKEQEAGMVTADRQVTDIAASQGMTLACFALLLRLSTLAPGIVTAILAAGSLHRSTACASPASPICRSPGISSGRCSGSPETTPPAAPQLRHTQHQFCIASVDRENGP